MNGFYIYIFILFFLKSYIFQDNFFSFISLNLYLNSNFNYSLNMVFKVDTWHEISAEFLPYHPKFTILPCRANNLSLTCYFIMLVCYFNNLSIYHYVTLISNRYVNTLIKL